MGSRIVFLVLGLCVKVLQCQAQSFFCGFENGLCTSDLRIVTKTKDPQTTLLFRTDTTTSSRGTGPNGPINGYYAYLEASDGEAGDHVSLDMKHLLFLDTACLSFNYQMADYGNGKMGSLQVYVNDGWTISAIARISGDQGIGWQSFQKTVRNFEKARWTLFRGSGYQSDIAIDNLQVTPGNCSGSNSPPTNAQPVIGSVPSRDFFCNFEFGFCENNVVIKTSRGVSIFSIFGRSNSSTPSHGTGPTDPVSGYFAYLDASRIFQGEYVRLEMRDSLNLREACLSFNYHMTDSGSGDMGSLLVEINRIGKFDQRTKINGDHGQTWHLFQRNISNFWIARWTLTRGSGIQGEIAIDNLKITPGWCTTDASVPRGTPGPTTVPGGGTPSPPNGVCQADILFLVDSSASIQDTGVNNYQLMKDFLSTLVDRLDIGPNMVRHALAIFSTNAQLQWDFSTYSARTDIKQAINNIPYIGGETFTSRAFNIYLDQLRPETGGNRPGVRDVIILLTDGSTTSADRRNLAPTLTSVRHEATVLGVGIGNIDINEMMTIVTPPFTQNYVNVQDFTGLIYVLDSVILGTGCRLNGGDRSSPGPGPSPRVQCLADIVFVIDESESIRDSNVGGRDKYQLAKNFASSLVNGLRANIDSGNIQIGAIRFSDNARVMFNLNDHTNAATIMQQINASPFTGGNTNTTGALRAARTLVLNVQGDRDNTRYPNRIVLITDGYATREQAFLEAEANTIKSQGTIITGIGVTNNINVRNLQRITSGPQNIFTVADFNQLETKTPDVIQAICPPF